ncbi:hypothetical protein BH23CHL5_BH23CHL5_28300 [soil metagenome]
MNQSTQRQPTYAERIQDCMRNAAECLAIIADEASNEGESEIAATARTLSVVMARMAADDYGDHPAGADEPTTR